LKSGKHTEIKKLILTASGGPFFGYNKEQLKNITVAQALAHPTWSMGQKITIDSATLMNKGFEVIEAVHLFGVSPEQIKVVVHRESIIHSMVEYIDNSIIAQMSTPDMRLCIQYAVAYPDRVEAAIPELDIFALSGLTFKEADPETFSLLGCAYDCIKKGGAMPAVLNAANEIAVGAFLKGKIEFYQISESVLDTVERLSASKDAYSLEDILAYDKEARILTQKILKL
jgi:1-deoxy-D-xylulose-5-phosphate reductoisomerase